MKRIEASERLIVALDVPDVEAARRMVERLEGSASFYKIGLALQLASGVNELVRSLIDSGKKVFLDYKYYDVPETLRKAVSRAAGVGVSFLTIHGPGSLIEAAVRAKGDSKLKLFTVTVLTSMDAGDMAEMGYTRHTPEELVLFRARKALAGRLRRRHRFRAGGAKDQGARARRIAGGHAGNPARGLPGRRSETEDHAGERHTGRSGLPGDRAAHPRCGRSPEGGGRGRGRNATGLRRSESVAPASTSAVASMLAAWRPPLSA